MTLAWLLGPAVSLLEVSGIICVEHRAAFGLFSPLHYAMADIRPPTPTVALHCYSETASIGGTEICRTELVFCEWVSAMWGVCAFARYCDRGEKSTPGKESSRKGKGSKCQNHLLLLSHIFLGISVSSENDDWHDPVANFYFSGQEEPVGVNLDTAILL